MKLLAIDQALKTSGYAVFNDDTLITYGHFNTPTDKEMGERLLFLTNKVADLIDCHKIDTLVVEDIHLTQTDYKSPLTFKHLAFVLGGIHTLAAEKKIPIFAYGASEWRKALGKWPQRRPEQKKHAISLIEKIYDELVTSDEADAICIGAAHLRKEECLF